MKSSERISGDGPWCWQSKAARRRIREAFDATHNIATALSVYDALTEIASDSAAETFTTTHAWIQRISGVSVRTIQNHLGVFAELKLLAISTPRLRAPSTYTLLAFGNDCATSGNGNASNGNRCATFGNDQFRAPLPTLEETSEETKKKDQNNACAEPSDIAVAPAPYSPTIISFSITGQGAGATWALTEAHAQKLIEAFVGVEVIAEARKALAWIDANPTKRKTARGMPAFLHRWLSNAANRGGGNGQSNRAKDTTVPWQRKTHEIDHSKGF